MAQQAGVLSRRSLIQGMAAAVSGLGCGSLLAGQTTEATGQAADDKEIAQVTDLAAGAGLARSTAPGAAVVSWPVGRRTQLRSAPGPALR